MAAVPIARPPSMRLHRCSLLVFATAGLLTIRAVMPIVAFAQPALVASPAQYRPGLGDLMTLAVQPRHVKLGLARRENNWTYAGYELHELQEAFQRAAAVWPKWRDFAIGDMIESTVAGPIAQLEAAINSQDADRYASAYGRLTGACNTCHQSAGAR